MPSSDRLAGRQTTTKSRAEFWKHVVIALGITVVCVQWVRLMASPRGDFDLHWELGRRLMAGEFLYTPVNGGDARGHDYPYLPFWALANAPFTLLPMHLALVLFFPLFVFALALLIGVLDRLTRGDTPLKKDALFWATAAAVALSVRFMLRDMMECGVNLALVAMSWLSIYLWTRHREKLAGLVLGLAISLKCTPALFLAYFVWKRQWKMAMATTAAAAAFTISPILVMGPAEYGKSVTFWFSRAWDGVAGTDPSRGVLGEEPTQNISLRPSLARYLMRLPDDHKARLDHPLFFDVLDLSPQTAGLVSRIIMLALMAAVAWRFRQPVKRRNDPTILWECAAVSILILLYSPITWGQHCVGVFPAFYLIARNVAAGRPLSGWMKAVIGTYAVFILGLNRTVIGKSLSWLIDSYHIHTWCFVALLAVAVACRRKYSAAANDQDESLSPPDRPLQVECREDDENSLRAAA